MVAFPTAEQIPLLELEDARSRPRRTIHYLGSKSRVVDAIAARTDELALHGSLVMDLFSGSGVVASRLADDHLVTAVDVQEYARVIAAALLSPARLSDSADLKKILDIARGRQRDLAGSGVVRLIAHETAMSDLAMIGNAGGFCDLLEHGSILGFRLHPTAPEEVAEPLSAADRELPHEPGTVLTRYYGGVYFSYSQAIELDALAAAVRTLEQPLRDTAMAALMSTASEIVSTVGNQFAQPVRPRDRSGKPKVAACKGIVRRRQRSVTESFVAWVQRYSSHAGPRCGGTAIRADFREALVSAPSDLAMVYADPPYTRDHYSRYYHVLETMALGDEPEISMVTVDGERQPSRGLYRVERHQSPFCIKSQAPAAFDELFDLVSSRRVPLVLSYSPFEENSAARPRLMTIDQIVDTAGLHFSSVEVGSPGRVAHSKLNAERLNTDVNYEAEVLITCLP